MSGAQAAVVITLLIFIILAMIPIAAMCFLYGDDIGRAVRQYLEKSQ